MIGLILTFFFDIISLRGDKLKFVYDIYSFLLPALSLLFSSTLRIFVQLWHYTRQF
jgi:hypothetical protein